MPVGLEVTVPEPVPALVTVRLKVAGGAGLNVAVTVLAAVILTTHEPVPLQAPDQLANTEPAAALALKVTEVPSV